MHRHAQLKRVIEDFDHVLEVLKETDEANPTVAAILVLAARVEALEDLLDQALPEAGRGH